MGWREVIIQTVWDYTGCTDMRAETTCAGIEDRLAEMPPPDRIALARELLEGTGRVVAERKLLEAARACMRETGWHLAPRAIARGSDGILEMACAEVEQQFAAMLADDAGDG